MAISFEEKDRAAIEARGMTVIEAKRVLYKAVEVFQPIFNKLWDICRNMSKEQIEQFLREDEE